MSVFMLYLKSTFAIILVMFWELTEIMHGFNLLSSWTSQYWKYEKFKFVLGYAIIFLFLTLIFGIIEN